MRTAPWSFRLKLIAEIEARTLALKLNRRSRVDSIPSEYPDAHLGGHEHGMARVEAGAGVGDSRSAAIRNSLDLFEQNRHGRIFGGKVVPNPAWAEALNDMADGDAFSNGSDTSCSRHVGRSKLERWMLFRNRREAHPAQVTEKWIAHNRAEEGARRVSDRGASARCALSPIPRRGFRPGRARGVQARSRARSQAQGTDRATARALERPAKTIATFGRVKRAVWERDQDAAPGQWEWAVLRLDAPPRVRP